MANLNSFLVAHDLQLELEQALARQASVGGDLVTCLLEVSAISEDRMLALLSEAYGRPAAPPGELPVAEASARRLVPRATAQRHVMYPFELRSELLAAFVQEPLPAAVEDDLVFALGVQLEQRIALAARVHQALARAYGVPLPPRMKELLERLDSPRAQECATSGNARGAPVTGGSSSARPDGASLGGSAAPRSNGETRDSSSAGKGDATLVGVAPARRMVDGAPSGGAPRQNARGARACPSTLPPPRTAPDQSQAGDIDGLGAERDAYAMPASRTPTIPCGPPVQAFTVGNSSVPPGAPPADFLMEATSATAADIEERRRRRASLPAGTSVLRDWALRELGLSEPCGLSERRRGPLTHAQAEKALEAARTPDEALRVYFDFARQYFEYTAMFRLRGDLAEGQDAWGPGATGDRVRGIGVALDLPSILSQARDTRAPFVGVPSRDGIDAVLAEDLGRSMRLEVACVPVLVRGRALVVLYGDLGSEPVLPDDVGDVISFASLLGSTLEKMLLRRKRDGSRVSKETDTLPPSAFPSSPSPDRALSDTATTTGAPPQAVGPRTRAASATPASPPVASAPGPGRSTSTAGPRPSTVATLRPVAPAVAAPTGPEIPASAVATTSGHPATLEPPRMPRVPSFDLDVDQRASTTEPAHAPPMVPTPLAPLAAFDAEREGTMTPLVPEALLDSECRPLESRPSPQAVVDAEHSVSRPPPVVRKTGENERVGNFPTPTRVAFEARRRNSPPPTAARADLDPLATPTGDTTPVVSPLAHLAALSATWTLDPAAVLGSSPPAAPIGPSAEARPGTALRPYSRPVAETLRVEPSYPRLTFADPSYADRSSTAPQLAQPVPDDPASDLAARAQAVRDGSAHHDPTHDLDLGPHDGPARGETARSEARQDGAVRDGSAHHDTARDRPVPDHGPAEPVPATPADPAVSAAVVAAGLRPMRIPHIAREEPESSPQPRPGAQGSTVPIARITHSPEASGGAVVVGARHPPASVGMAFASLPPVLIHADLVETVIAGGAAGERALGEILEIGEAAIPSVFSRFPGPLSVDRQYAATELLRPDECGPVLRILSALRRLALPFLAVRSADSSPEVRFWATYLLGDLHYQDAAIALWPRLFDEDLSVRTIALHAARTFVASKEAGAPIRVGLERIVASTEESEERRLHAIATIGALEWTPFVPALLRILDRSRSPISIAAADALAALTGEDFGPDPKTWNKWWKNNGRLFGEED